MLHGQRCQLVWQGWEIWQPSWGRHAEVRNRTDLIPHVMRPNRVGGRLLSQAPSEESGAAAACLSCSTLLCVAFYPSSSRNNMNRLPCTTVGQPSSGLLCKYMHLFAFMKHLSQNCLMPDAMQSVAEVCLNKTHTGTSFGLEADMKKLNE